MHQYFLNQRINPTPQDAGASRDKYLKELEWLHRLAVAAMRSKQTTDMTYIAEMRNIVGMFADSCLNQSSAKDNQ